MTWMDKSTDKELTIQLIFSNDGMVNVDLLGFTKTRFQIVVRESAKLQLEGECWFNVSDGLFFSPHSIKVTKSEVHHDGVLSRVTKKSRNSMDSSAFEDGILFVDRINDLKMRSAILMTFGASVLAPCLSMNSCESNGNKETTLENPFIIVLRLGNEAITPVCTGCVW